MIFPQLFIRCSMCDIVKCWIWICSASEAGSQKQQSHFVPLCCRWCQTWWQRTQMIRGSLKEKETWELSDKIWMMTSHVPGSGRVWGVIENPNVCFFFFKSKINRRTKVTQQLITAFLWLKSSKLKIITTVFYLRRRGKSLEFQVLLCGVICVF